MSAFKNLTGLKFGRLTAIERAGTGKGGHVLWQCKCDCRKEIITWGNSLIQGRTKSCGCLNREHTIEMIIKNIKHCPEGIN